METINVDRETKERFEQARYKQRMSEKRNIFQNEFINLLIDNLNNKEVSK